MMKSIKKAVLVWTAILTVTYNGRFYIETLTDLAKEHQGNQ